MLPYVRILRTPAIVIEEHTVSIATFGNVLNMRGQEIAKKFDAGFLMLIEHVRRSSETCLSLALRLNR
ncbi:hypothetical protein A1O3_09623 [Capronia epimyces CBS 606.96]|uniref:Uncharacterized protein n=1 Tax=Capronia epimyces CBS 606.96 TaxID=1182542 RepID=W9XAA3_9EURO|nr:uncharacterized protein A1O3_09623 [Capronia epimyces CBS 606.96]EXJ77397.1 hypothetical protein A1O3_09623 [Capronia epimyces CBS 606.96]